MWGFDDPYLHWNIWQWRAGLQPVDETKPVTILGGPGTGKTEALLARIAHLLHNDVDPRDIAYLCFHPRMAAEFQRRLSQLPDLVPAGHAEGAWKVAVWTPEQWALDFLRLNHHVIAEIPTGFVVWDRAIAVEVMTEVGPQGNFGNPLDEETVTAILDWNDRNLAQGGGLKFPGREPSWLGIINQYTVTKKGTNALDIAELVPTAIRLMERNPGSEWIWPGNRPRHLLVDGAQAASSAQRTLLDFLNNGARSLTVTWDPNQDISSGAGGDPINPWPSGGTWKPETIYLLRPNVRAARLLADAARRLAESPSTPGLRALGGFACRVHRDQPALVKRFSNDDATKEFLVNRVYHMHGGGRRWKEVAVICRNPEDVRRVQAWLETAGVPCQGWKVVPDPPCPELRRVIQLLTAVLRPADVATLLDAAFDEEARRSVPVRQLEQSLNDAVRGKRGDLYEAAQHHIGNFRPGGIVHTGLTTMMEAKAQIDSLLTNRQATLRDVCQRSLELMRLAKDDDHSPGISLFLQVSESLARNPGETLSDLTQRFLDRANRSLYPCFVPQEDAVTVTPVSETPGLEWPAVFFLDADMPQEGRTQQEEERIRFTAFTRGSEEVYYLVPLHRGKRIWPDPWRVARLLEHPDVDLDTEGPKNSQERTTGPMAVQRPTSTGRTSSSNPAPSKNSQSTTTPMKGGIVPMESADAWRSDNHPQPINPSDLVKDTDTSSPENSQRDKKGMYPVASIILAFLLGACVGIGAMELYRLVM